MHNSFDHAGKFSTTTNAGSCATWLTCVPGQYVFAAPSLQKNRQCKTVFDCVYNMALFFFTCVFAWTFHLHIGTANAAYEIVCDKTGVLTSMHHKRDVACRFLRSHSQQ
jgi:hypothetical protein